MSLDTGRIAAVVRKELREYRRNRFIIVTMAVLPLVFLIAPTLDLFRISPDYPTVLIDREVRLTLLLMLIVPVVMPATIAAYSIVGERTQGTLEPFLTTPIRRDELLLGKAIAAAIPSFGVSYLVYFGFAIAVRLGAAHAVGVALWRAPQVLAQLLFIPLLATWAIWVCIAISARSNDVRVAQQLGTLASLPALGITSLISFEVIPLDLTVAVAFAVGLGVVDVVAWRVVARTFNRERLIVGPSSGTGRRAPRRT